MNLIPQAVRTVLLVGLVFNLFSFNTVADAAEAKEIKPVKQWTGTIEKALQREAPAQGYIVSEKALVHLWQAWKIKDEMPIVDFEKELVLVITLQTGGYFSKNAEVDDQGDLSVKILTSAHLSLDHKYKYVITLIKRDGIKTIHGKAIEKE